MGINLGGDLSWNDSEDLLSELNEESVQGSVDLFIDVGALPYLLAARCVSFPSLTDHQVTLQTYILLAIGDRSIDQLGVLWLLGSSEDKGRVGGGILRLVFADSYKSGDSC